MLGDDQPAQADMAGREHMVDDQVQGGAQRVRCILSPPGAGSGQIQEERTSSSLSLNSR